MLSYFYALLRVMEIAEVAPPCRANSANGDPKTTNQRVCISNLIREMSDRNLLFGAGRIGLKSGVRFLRQLALGRLERLRKRPDTVPP